MHLKSCTSFSFQKSYVVWNCNCFHSHGTRAFWFLNLAFLTIWDQAMCIGTEIFFSHIYEKDFTIESDSMIGKGNTHTSIYSIHITFSWCKDCFQRSVTGCSICPFCCLPGICSSIHPGFLSIFGFVSDLHFVWHGFSACCHNSHGIHSELNREQTSVPCHDQSSLISTYVVQWRKKKHRTLLWRLDELDHREHSICIRI